MALPTEVVRGFENLQRNVTIMMIVFIIISAVIHGRGPVKAIALIAGIAMLVYFRH